LAIAINSRSELAGTLGLMAITTGPEPSIATGAKAVAGS
jgi:hypothetical protein